MSLSIRGSRKNTFLVTPYPPPSPSSSSSSTSPRRSSRLRDIRNRQTKPVRPWPEKENIYRKRMALAKGGSKFDVRGEYAEGHCLHGAGAKETPNGKIGLSRGASISGDGSSDSSSSRRKSRSKVTGMQQQPYQTPAPFVWRQPEEPAGKADENASKGAEWVNWVRETVQGLRTMAGDEDQREADVSPVNLQDRRRKSTELQQLISGTPGALSPCLGTATWGPPEWDTYGKGGQEHSIEVHQVEALRHLLTHLPETLAARLRRGLAGDLSRVSTLIAALLGVQVIQAAAAEPVDPIPLCNIPPPATGSQPLNNSTSSSFLSSPLLTTLFPSPSSTLANHLPLPTLILTLIHTLLTTSIFYLSLPFHPVRTSLLPFLLNYCPWLLPIINLIPLLPLPVFLPLITYPVSILLGLALNVLLAGLALLEEDVLRRPGLLTRWFPTLLLHTCIVAVVLVLNLVLPRFLGGSGLGARVLASVYRTGVLLAYMAWLYVLSPWSWAGYVDMLLRLSVVQHGVLRLRQTLWSWRFWVAVGVALLGCNYVLEVVWESDQRGGAALRRVLAVEGGRGFAMVRVF